MYVNSFINKLLKFIHLQLFITLMSLPIFLAWGLPISLMAAVATFLFSPFLTAFLLISSLIFFTELLYLPNNLLIWLLEYVTDVWLYLMSFEHQCWLIGFTKPSFWFLILLPLLTIGIMLSKHIKTQKQSSLFLTLLLLITVGYLKWLQIPTQLTINIPCNNGEVTFMHKNNKTFIIDPGFIGQRFSAPSWVQYTLIPEIIKQTGSTTLDYVIILKPGTIILEALTTLCSNIKVKTLYYPYWSGDMTPSEKRNWGLLQKTLQEHGTILKRIGKYTINIDNLVSIAPQDKQIKTSNKTYAQICYTLI